METRSDRVRNTASCSSSGIAVKVPIVTRPTGKRGGSAGTSKKFIGSRQIGMFQPVDEALDCGDDLASSGLGHAQAPAPESATSNNRKRRAASGKGSSISAKKVCIGVEDFPDAPMSAPPCELDESIAPVDIVADILTVCIPQPDASTTPRNERAHVSNEVLKAFKQLMLNETVLQPSPGYIPRLGEEALKKRASLMQWIMEVCESFSMAHVSHGCVLNYLERAIEHTKVPGGVPLFGVAAVLIGSKFCEIHPVCLEQLQQCVPNFTCDQIRKMERDMLQVLKWQLNVVTTHHFVNVLLQLIPDRPERVKLKVRKHVELLVDLTMLDVAFIGHKRSMIAVAAMRTALELCNVPLPELSRYSPLVSSNEEDLENYTHTCTRLKKTFDRYFPRTGAVAGRLSPQNVVQAAKPECAQEAEVKADALPVAPQAGV